MNKGLCLVKRRERAYEQLSAFSRDWLRWRTHNGGDLVRVLSFDEVASDTIAALGRVAAAWLAAEHADRRQPPPYREVPVRERLAALVHSTGRSVNASRRSQGHEVPPAVAARCRHLAMLSAERQSAARAAR